MQRGFEPWWENLLSSGVGPCRGSSALGLVLHGAAVLLKWKNDWDWFVNLDASDYPFIKQDGSQHVILNRNFVEYSIQGWENLPRLLLLYFSNTRSSHKGYFQTLACNTNEFSDAVINSNLRFINSDNTARDPSDFGTSNSDRILKREVAFVGNVSENSPSLDMIDAHILHRGGGMVSPGGWCLGSSNWLSDPCDEWGDPGVLRPRPAAKELEKHLMKAIKDMSIRPRRCDHQ
ncbi:hypothetical protein RND71_010920 [Anisodus tanguticus]|uniref:Uncharacterized protein n=1 Tax=Anisodus tanguticus TaxID=243964 RepID=A0AAE1SK71_9SOLA|nr:hypothetical protein RND71_010920 [Anisodus tanguticus]